MRTFAQKQKTTEQTSSTKTTIPHWKQHLCQSSEVRSILHLQRTIGNQAVQRLPQANAEERNTASATTPSTRFAHDFSQVPIHPKAPTTIQQELTVSTPGDQYEREADRVADQVMRMPEPQLQRTSACGGGCPRCQTAQLSQKHKHLQTNKYLHTNDVSTVGSTTEISKAVHSSGHSLDAETKAFMESRFDHDFSQVRVHTDHQALNSANTLNARAYTLGQDIVFGAGEYSPKTYVGRQLLAHELTHILQQNPLSANKPTIIQKQEVQESPPAENPSYDEAIDHVRTFYQRQQVIVQTLARMRDRALDLFSIYSSETMNPEEPGLLDLMEAAIAFIPVASAMGQTLRVLRNRHGFLIRPLMDSPISLAGAAVTQSSQLRVLLPGSSEGPAREEVRASTIQSLAEIDVDSLAAWWQEEDMVREQLRSLRYTQADIDLLAQVRAKLGDVPTASDLSEASRLARDQFELQLYRRFYFGSSRRASIHSFIDEFTDRSYLRRERPATLQLEDVPRAVRRRIGGLNGWETVLRDWTPGGLITVRALGHMVTIPETPSQTVVDRMRGELLMPDLAERVLRTYRLLFNPLNPAVSLTMHGELRRIVDAAGVEVDPTVRVLRTRDGEHEPLIFQRALLTAGASESELEAIVRILSSGPVVLRREYRGAPYVNETGSYRY